MQVHETLERQMEFGFWITSSGTMGEAHSGKLLATPSQAQQCCGRPSGPNIVFLKTYIREGTKRHFQFSQVTTDTARSLANQLKQRKQNLPL